MLVSLLKPNVAAPYVFSYRRVGTQRARAQAQNEFLRYSEIFWARASYEQPIAVTNWDADACGFRRPGFLTTAWPEVPFQGMRALMLSYADLRAVLLDRWGLWKSRTS